MRVLLVCPAARGSRTGNRRTAERWARLLESLGHEAWIAGRIGDDHRTRRADLVVALHAGRSADAIERSRQRWPARPIVLALTGTDLSHDIFVRARARRSLELADRIVVLHAGARGQVPRRHRAKVRIVLQSARAPPRAVPKARRTFDVAVVGHLRAVKDPLLAALAARRLPSTSRVRVLHAGGVLEPALGRAARREQRSNRRYRWLGELPPARALRLIAHAHVFVLTSRSEGGANVLGEAAMCGTPVIATRIPAAVSALGAAYPALFPAGDDRALARLIARAENDPAWLTELTRRVRARRPLFDEARERAAWRALLAEVATITRARGRGA